NGGKVSVFGAQSRFAALYELFGFSEVTANKANKAHGDLISYEYIAEANPPYLLVLDRDQAIGRESGEAFKKLNNSLISQTDAVKNGHVHYLNPHAWYISASGIQATQIMIDDINALLN
ncbi:ABC transporter substrate-binding protein, partial [Vibrio sp. M260118]|uniref:ABC transporter substrate-binding protein n=1 Tax=Vibrio sp. M260118 TaxID=3020896 RepID=UPI002F414FAA